MVPQHSFLHLINKIRQRGIIFYFHHLINSLKKSFRPKWQRVFIFESPLSEIVPNEYNSTTEVSILREIDEKLLSFANRRGSWYPQQIKNLFLKGNLCFIAIIDNKIVSCLWTSFNQVYLPDIEYNLIVAEDIAPLIDGYTLDEYRGKGLYKILWNECYNYLVKSKKYSKIYGFINPANKRSIMVHDKLNLNKIILDIALIKFLGIRIHIKKKLNKS